MVDETGMLRASHLLQLTVVSMLGVALVMVHSAAMSLDRGALDSTAFLTSRHTIYATLAIAAMLVASRFNVRRLLHAGLWANPMLWCLLGVAVLLALTMVPGVGVMTNGAARWLALGPRSWGLTFQPSELAKWLLVLAVPCWCAWRGKHIRSFTRGLLPPLALIGLYAGLIVVHDMGTAILLVLVAMCILLAAGARPWHLMLALPPAAVVVAAALLTSPFRLARLTAFIDPWADARGTGYHPIQSMIAIANGGLTGRGLGNGVQKFGYLPEDTTDFLFAVVCEELGLGGAVLVVGLYAALLLLGFAVLRDCRDAFGRLVALGVLLTIGFQALINIAVVTVVVPTKGIALPLLSAGGTGWILTAAGVGLLASLDEANRLERLDGEGVPSDRAADDPSGPVGRAA